MARLTVSYLIFRSVVVAAALRRGALVGAVPTATVHEKDNAFRSEVRGGACARMRKRTRCRHTGCEICITKHSYMHTYFKKWLGSQYPI